MSHPSPQHEFWSRELQRLCDSLATEVLRALRGRGQDLARIVGQGAGDVSFGIDLVAETVIDGWLEEVGAQHPVSLLTEDRGWRHRYGPKSSESSAPADPFSHGGPRIALDPIDGTRNLMHDLRSAWTVVSLAGPGSGVPNFRELQFGLVSELPTTRCARRRVLQARAGEPCGLEIVEVDSGSRSASQVLRVDADDRADSGYFSFFRYSPDLRPAIGAVEASFFDRLSKHEHSDLRNCYEDQYITSGGQLTLLALGSYRMVCDLRGRVGRVKKRKTVTAKPYDLAGAILCAQMAGCQVRNPDGSPLDFELDVETPVDFVAYVNAATAKRLDPHLQAALSERLS